MTYEELFNIAITAMTELHKSAELDENCENAIIDPADWRKFVDAHAKLLYERNQLNAAGGH